MNILITGASSGIGRQLAIEYAKIGANLLNSSRIASRAPHATKVAQDKTCRDPQEINSMNLLNSSRDTSRAPLRRDPQEINSMNLFLCARNITRLQETKEKCKDFSVNIFLKELDVKNQADCEAWISGIEENYALDLIIANAGISAGTSGGTESEAQIREIFDINLYGVLNIINPAIVRMKERKTGQIAIISSLAGFRGLPSSPAYSGSKAAVRVYGEGLRGNLAEFGIKVSVVCPGYVKTPMTDVNNFPMPFLMTPEKASQKIIKGLQKNKSRIAFPFGLYFVVWLATLLPPCLTDRIFAKLPKKKAFE
jgi:short-subunit dehydrogenase